MHPDCLEHVESAQLRHLDVEEQQVGRRPLDGFDRRGPAVVFSGEFNVGLSLEQFHDTPAGRCLVVDNEGSNRRLHGSARGESTVP